jgi:hypothetical protein
MLNLPGINLKFGSILMFAILYIKPHYWKEFLRMFITYRAKLIWTDSMVQ